MGEVTAPTARSFPKIGTVRIGTLLFFDIKSTAGLICRSGKSRKSCATVRVCQFSAGRAAGKAFVAGALRRKTRPITVGDM
jgi:hypothetical protein